MRKLDMRRGMVGGGLVALMGAAGAAAHSPDPLPTFPSVLAFGLAGALAAIGLAARINRPSKPPIRW